MSPSAYRRQRQMHRIALPVVGFLTGFLAGCSTPPTTAVTSPANATLRIGYGLSTGQTPQAGIRQVTSIMALEGLIAIDRAGRPQPWLAESWTLSDDGLTLKVDLRPEAKFHDGSPATADVVTSALRGGLPGYLGPAFSDIKEIVATSPTQIEFRLARPSAFLIESLDNPIQLPGSEQVGTGPFAVVSRGDDIVEMSANRDYYEGVPQLSSVTIRAYPSVRAAWADLLRDNVDMLYDVGADALQSLEQSNRVHVFSYQRSYVYVALFNFEKPIFRDASFRRALNAAIDREQLVKTALRGLGSPADGPIRSTHWAYDTSAPKFSYAPVPAPSGPVTLHLLVTNEPSLEPLVLELQRQLSEIGVRIIADVTTLDDWYARASKGDFDLLFADASSGPSILRAYRLWHSEGEFNFGKFDSPVTDRALDAIREAHGDEEYRSAVAAFQRAIVEDPPAIFLAWSERARAVSTRFDVPVEPGRDILSTLRLWRPVPDDARSRAGTD